MLHLIVKRFVPAPLHRFILRQVHRIRVVWWRRVRMPANDCRVIALDDSGAVLLVRHSYGNDGWMLPGGRPDRGESPIEAAIRELREETGCGLLDASVVAGPEPGTQHRRYFVAGRASGKLEIDGREIVEARFCAVGSLPSPISERLAHRLQQHIALYNESAGRSVDAEGAH